MMESDIDELVECLENEKHWTREMIKLLIQQRLEMEKDFDEGVRKKSVLWRLCLRSIKNINPNFPFNISEVIKKYNNLLQTYKRAKRRNKQSGRNRTQWEFFDLFDKTLAAKHAVNPPPGLVYSTLDESDSSCRNNESILNDSVLCTNENEPSTHESDYENEDCNARSTSYTTIKRARKSKRNEEIQLKEIFANFEKEDKARHQQFMDIEKRKCEIEEKKLEVLEEVKAMIGELIDKM